MRRTLDELHAASVARPWRLLLAAASVLLVFATPARAMIMQADDQFACVAGGADVSAFMRTHHASVLRMVVPYHGRSDALACAEGAAVDGYRVYLSIQYSNAWSPRRVAAYFRRTLAPFAPYAWAVSVGNEQDLVQGAPATGAKYRKVWNAVEPILARVAPRAIRVYGETSPFGFPFLQASFGATRPRGAQVIAFHCYDVKNGGITVVPQVAAWAAREHFPLWCSEMSAARRSTPHPWLLRDSLRHWDALVARTEARSPDLKMVSYYRWPQIGAF